MQFLEFLDRYGKQMTTLLMFVTTLINTPLEVSGLNEKKMAKIYHHLTKYGVCAQTVVCVPINCLEYSRDSLPWLPNHSL